MCENSRQPNSLTKTGSEVNEAVVQNGNGHYRSDCIPLAEILATNVSIPPHGSDDISMQTLDDTSKSIMSDNSKQPNSMSITGAGVDNAVVQNGYTGCHHLVELLAADVSRPSHGSEDISMQTFEDPSHNQKRHLNGGAFSHHGTQLSENGHQEYLSSASASAGNQTPLSRDKRSGLSKRFRELSPEECYRKKCRLSRILFRLCILGLFLLLGLPCNLFTIYCLTSPVVLDAEPILEYHKNISSNETVKLTTGTNTINTWTNKSISVSHQDSLELQTLSSDQNNLPDSEFIGDSDVTVDLSDYVCFENVTTAQEILSKSRYWIEGVAIFMVTVVGLLGK